MWHEVFLYEDTYLYLYLYFHLRRRVAQKKVDKEQSSVSPWIGKRICICYCICICISTWRGGWSKKSWQRAEHRVVLDCAMLTRESWRGRRHFQRVQNTWKRGSKGLKLVTLVQVVYRQVWKQDQYHTQWAFDGSKVSNFGGCVILDDNNKTHRMTTWTSILTVPIMWVSSNMKITRT